MSTRGVIARQQGDGWEGVYQHSDSYPTWLGKEIWHQLHNGYNMDIERFLIEAIDKHPGGWSNYPDRCYCHWKGRENDPPMIMNDQTADPLFIEWVYVLNAHTKTMAILSHKMLTKKPPSEVNSHHCKASRIIHLDGTKETEPASWYVHQLIKVVRLNDLEPDWEAIEN